MAFSSARAFGTRTTLIKLRSGVPERLFEGDIFDEALARFTCAPSGLLEPESFDPGCGHPPEALLDARDDRPAVRGIEPQDGCDDLVNVRHRIHSSPRLRGCGRRRRVTSPAPAPP